MLAEFTFPFVLKPTVSWTGQSDRRLLPMEVIDRGRGSGGNRAHPGRGSSVLAQEFASGRREGVTLFIVGRQVKAACAHAAYRTHPPLGGASVMRESIPVLPDLYQPAVRAGHGHRPGRRM